MVAEGISLRRAGWRIRSEDADSFFRTGISWGTIAEDRFALCKKTTITAPPPSVDAHDPAENRMLAHAVLWVQLLEEPGLSRRSLRPISRKFVRRLTGRRLKERRRRLSAGKRRAVRGDGLCGSSQSRAELRPAAWRKGFAHRTEASSFSLGFRRWRLKLQRAPRPLFCRKLREAAFAKSSR